jgi:hypothetical protein
MTRAVFVLLLFVAAGLSTAAAQQPICSENPSALERLVCRDTTLAGGGAPPGTPAGTPLPPPPPPPQMPPPPTTTGTGTLYISLTNPYDASLRAMGIAGVLRAGVDQASGMLTWNEASGTFEGVLSAFAGGSYQATTFAGNCGDQSAGEQRIYAVGHVEAWQGQPAYLAPRRDSLVTGRFGPEAIVFYFFPESAPQFTAITTGRCQGPIRFEGYGGGANPAPHPWLPQRRAAGWFLPFNDTRWTTQNGLIVRMPPENEWVRYWDKTQVLRAEGVDSPWDITVVHGGYGP